MPRSREELITDPDLREQFGGLPREAQDVIMERLFPESKPEVRSEVISQIAPREETIFQELGRTRREQIKAGQKYYKGPASILSDPIQSMVNIMSYLNLPLAYTGVSPALSVAGRRFVKEPIAKITTEKAKLIGMSPEFSRTAGELMGETGDIGFQFLAPAAGMRGIGSVAQQIARGTPKMRQARKIAADIRAIQPEREQEAAKVAEELRQVSAREEALEETVVPRGKEALTEKRREFVQFPSKISPVSKTEREVGLEYGGTTTQPEPNLQELGLYGAKVKQTRDYFNDLYESFRKKAGDIPVETKELNAELEEIKTMTRGDREIGPATAERIRDRFQTWRSMIPAEAIPEIEAAIEKAAQEGKPFTLTQIEDIVNQIQAKPTLTVNDIISHIKGLRDQARRSSSLYTEFLRNEAASKLVSRLEKALEGTDYFNEWQQINQQYRDAQPFIGLTSVPSRIANKDADAILRAMFPMTPTGGRISAPALMKQFLGEEKFNQYARAFHETIFDLQNFDSNYNTWQKMPHEQRVAIYGETGAKQLDEIFSGLNRYEKKMTNLLAKDIPNLAKKAEQLEKDLGKLGYEIDPGSATGEMLATLRGDPKISAMESKIGGLGFTFDPETGTVRRKSRTEFIRGGAMGLMMGIGGPWGLRQLGLAINQYIHGVPMWMYHTLEFSFFALPGFMLGISKLTGGSQRIANFFNAATNQEMISSANALRELMMQNGYDPDKILDELGVKKVR